MDKQTKQLIVLGVLVVAGGIALYFLYFGKDDSGATTTTSNAPAINTPPAPADGAQAGGPQPAGPQPAGGEKGPQPAAGAPATKVVDKEIPPETQIPEARYSWQWEPVPENPPEDYVVPFDPLFVRNIDVVDPERKKYIEQLKEEWVLEGITETPQDVKIIDDQGNEIGRKRMQVKEAWFVDKRRPYKEKDRLTNTRFQIKEIFIDHETGTSGVILLGDTGALVTMYLAPADRYGEK